MTLLALCAAALALAVLLDRDGGRSVDVELRSWVVAGRGRHLYAQIHGPWEVSGVVEYWSTAQRQGWSGAGALIARMPEGQRIWPLMGPADNRLEASWRVTPRQAWELKRDRVFSRSYFLLGPNSSSGLRAALEDAGLRLPLRMRQNAGILGEFPGLGMSPGREVDAVLRTSAEFRASE